jgi:flagellar hook assembly protein FlgD
VAGKPDLPITNGKMRLEQNFPNPLKRQTKISYQLPTEGYTSLAVYNIAGQKIKTLVKEAQNVGTHNATWNGQDESGKPVSAGIYIYRLQTGNGCRTRKMTVIR